MPRLLLDSTWDDISQWFSDHGWAIVAYVVITIIACIAVRKIVPHIVRPAVVQEMDGRPDLEVERRANTLSGVIVNTAQFILIVVAIFTILPELGFDIRALLAGVSITAVALGLGAQSLVKDSINGVFILTENQYGRGDTITLYAAGVPPLNGTVEDVTLRRTVVRDFDGVIYSVPNGSVIATANLTRDFPRVRVSVPVHVSSDMEAVRRIVDEVGQALADDAEFAERIVEAPRYVGIDQIDANGIAVQVNGAVTPGSQREIAFVLRTRVLKALHAAGVKTPWG
jgi:small conductance mechanosensitive channel